MSVETPARPQTHLSFGKVQPRSNLRPLNSTQVFVLAEGALQFADLLGGELGPHPSLLLGGLPLAVISHLALGTRRVTATICRGRTERLNSFSPNQELHTECG